MKLPLSRSLLNDPAFSTDPRAHPHHASAYKSVPPTPAPPRIPRRARVKALVRRLTTRHNLDRIDELDETDPFGTSHHHHGPYEAIATSLAPTPRPYKRQSDPLPLRPGQHHSASRSPFPIPETGLSLHLEPGQILQQNTIYSYASRIARLQSPLEPNACPILFPDLSRSHPPQMRPPEDRPSLDLPDTSRNQPSPPLRARQERHSGNQPYHTSDTLAHHRNRDTTPNTRYRIEKPITPPRYESKFYGSNPPQSPQSPSIISQNAQTQLTNSQVPPLPPRGSAPQSLYSLDVSYTSTKSLEPPRMRHLPKRLVMPTPLQTQQPQYNIFPAGTAALQDHHHLLQGARFEEKPATYTPKPRLLRKKSSTLHAKTPIPDVPQNDTPPIRASSPSNEDKERTRRRLSKRKVDI